MSCIWWVSPIHGGCFPREMVTTMEGFAQKSGSLKGKKRRGKGFFRIPMACSVHGKTWWKLLKFKSKTLWKETNRNSYPLPFWIRSSVQQNFYIESLVHNIVRTMNPKLVFQWWWSWHAFFLVLTHLTCTDFFDIKMNPHDDNRISHHWLGLLLIPNLFLAPLSFACHFRGSPLRRSAIFNSCQTNKSIILWFLKLGRKAKQFLVCDEFLEHDTCPNLVYGLR